MSLFIFTSLFSSLLRFYLAELLYRLVCDRQTGSRLRRWLFGGGYGALSLLAALPAFQSISLPLTHGAMLTLCLRHEMRWPRRLLLFVLLVATLALGAVLAIAALAWPAGMSIPEFREDTAALLPAHILSLFVAILLVRLMAQFLPRKAPSKYPHLSPLSLLLPAGSCVIAYFFFRVTLYADDPWSARLSLSICVCLFLANIFLIDLLEHFSRAQAAEREREAAQAELRQEVEHYRQMFLRQRETARAMQDIRDQLAVGMELLRQGRTEEAGGLLERVAAGTGRQEGGRLSGNVAVDAILDAKRRRTEELGVAFTASLAMPPSCRIPHDDLAVVVGNILDNALNACEKVPEGRYIRFTIKQFRDYLCLKMENSALPERGGQDSSVYPLHGFGLQNVRQVAEKYQGNVMVRQGCDRFTIIVLLRNEAGREI